MTSVKDAVKESLVGTSQEPQPSQQIKSYFLRHARKDEETGELYMSQEDFVNAIAPKYEDYVSHPDPCRSSPGLCCMCHTIRKGSLLG